jgi:VCBS repeat-containing protein
MRGVRAARPAMTENRDAMTTPSITITSSSVVNATDKSRSLFNIQGITADVPFGLVTVQILNSANQVVATTQAGASGTWSATIFGSTFSALTDGTYTVQASTPAGNGTTVSTTQTLIVDETPPVTGADTASLVAGATLNVTTAAQGVLANDTDSSGHALSVTGVSIPTGTIAPGQVVSGTYGDLTINADGTYSYVANNAAGIAFGQTGVDRFTYLATDQAGNTTSGNLAVTVASGITVPAAPVSVFGNGVGPSSDLNAGDVVQIGIHAGTLTVTGTPALQLSNGRVATYTEGSGTALVFFTYTVQPGDQRSASHGARSDAGHPPEQRQSGDRQRGGRPACEDRYDATGHHRQSKSIREPHQPAAGAILRHGDYHGA